MSSEEETLRRLAVELRILEGSANAIQSRINLVNAALTELRVAHTTLEGLEKEKEETSLFVPIGGGSYVKAKLQSAETVTVGIGAGIAIERTIKEAKENLKNRMADLEKTRTTLHQQLTQVLEKIQDGRSRFEELTSKLSKAEEASSVREAEGRT